MTVKPTLIDKYTVLKKLGSGNFATVYECKDPQDKHYALKVIDKRQVNNEGMQEQMLREIGILHRINHKNVLRLFDVIQSKNHIYMVTELVTGGELFDVVVKNKRLTEPRARKYFMELLDGLEALYKHRITHRDLKPENLLLDANDTLKISDFGLSNLQQGDLLQTVCGTPNYVAPELLSERGYNGHSADIWSAGVILYIMVSGTMPFDDRNMNKLLFTIQRGTYRPLSFASTECQDLIARMLAVDPHDRIQLQDIRRHPWMNQQ